MQYSLLVYFLLAFLNRLIFSDDEEIEAVNTWKEHIEHAGDLSVNAKAEKLSLPFHSNSSVTGKTIDIFDNLDELHLKKRIQRNMRKMEPREKEIFCAMHQYKDILCTKSTKKTVQTYALHALNHIMKENGFFSLKISHEGQVVSFRPIKIGLFEIRRFDW